jgi:hypothetical protein
MNYISCIIQILEIPIVESYNDNTVRVQFNVQLPQLRTRSELPIIIKSIIWGDLGYDIANYYQVNDYVLIEGYISTIINSKIKKEIPVLNITKLYPFLFTLKSNNSD